MTEEERRAALYREQCRNRARFRASLCARLTGDETAAMAVRDAFAPLLPAPLDGWDCPGPAQPTRPAWADRLPGFVERPNHLK